jgi:hypothetical protein
LYYKVFFVVFSTVYIHSIVEHYARDRKTCHNKEWKIGFFLQHLFLILLSFVACLALSHFFPYYITNCTIFEKVKVLEHKKRVLIFSTEFV